MGYLIESKKNWNFNISHEDVFLQVYSFLSTSKWLNTRELADRFHAGLAHSFRHCTICLWGIHRYTILYWSSYFTPSRTLQLLLEHTCAPQRFIPGEFRWCSSYCSLLRISIEDWICLCSKYSWVSRGPICLPPSLLELPTPVIMLTVGRFQGARNSPHSPQICCSPKMFLEPLQAWNSDLFDRLK